MRFSMRVCCPVPSPCMLGSSGNGGVNEDEADVSFMDKLNMQQVNARGLMQRDMRWLCPEEWQ